MFQVDLWVSGMFYVNVEAAFFSKKKNTFDFLCSFDEDICKILLYFLVSLLWLIVALERRNFCKIFSPITDCEHCVL